MASWVCTARIYNNKTEHKKHKRHKKERPLVPLVLLVFRLRFLSVFTEPWAARNKH